MPARNLLVSAALLLAIACGVGCGETEQAQDLTQKTQGKPQATPAPAADPAAMSRDDVPFADNLVWVPAGTFTMGSDRGDRNHRPARTVRMDGFWMDATPVTNAQFKAFVDATGYVTAAEKPIPRSELPEEIRDVVPDEELTPRSMVFKPTQQQVDLNNELQWWTLVEGANWKQPEGPGSSIDDRMDHPVVHVSYDDALAYCEWAGRSLPTEAQFEYAARGGLESNDYVWGNEQVPDEGWQANIWQGTFPVTNDKDDGYVLTSPVKTYPANGFGLYDMSGNVWEWCADWFDKGYYAIAPDANPPGPKRYFDTGPRAADGVDKRVIRGGSFLCSDSYCLGYMPMTRQSSDPYTAHNHTGFRTVDNTLPPPDGQPKAIEPLAGEGE